MEKEKLDDIKEREREIKSNFRLMLISSTISFFALIISIIVFVSTQK